MLFLEVEIQTGAGERITIKIDTFDGFSIDESLPTRAESPLSLSTTPKFPVSIRGCQHLSIRIYREIFPNVGGGANGVALLDRGKEGLKRFARNAKHSCTTITRLMYTELMRVHRNIRHGTRGR